MTKPNDTQRNDKLMKMVHDFAKEYEKIKADGDANVAFFEGIQKRVDMELRNSIEKSPGYYELREMQRSVNLEIRVQYERMLNAADHYTLALDVAMAIEGIQKKATPELAEEAKRIAEELRKSVNDQIAKKVSGLFSDKGHEGMYR